MTIMQVANIAKQVMLRYGSHHPIVVVEGTEGGFSGLLKHFPDTANARVEEMSRAGFFFGQQQPQVGRLQQVFLVAEGWMSQATDGKTPSVHPSQDPQRREVLMVHGLDIEESKSSFVVLTVARDSQGRVSGLEEFTSTEGGLEVQSPLLPAFVAGFQAGSQSKVRH